MDSQSSNSAQAAKLSPSTHSDQASQFQQACPFPYSVTSQSQSQSQTQSQQPYSLKYAPQLQQPYPYYFPSSSQLSQACPFPYSPQIQVPPEFTPSQSKKTSKFKKQRQGASQKGRMRNFNSKEDEALVRAWVAVSENGIIGNSQAKSNFWNRIYNTFNELLCIKSPTEDADRNPNSLCCRWQTIQRQVNKFCRYFATIDRNPRSGTSFDDRVEDAKKTFRSCEGFDFTMEEVWKILRNNPKWNEKHGSQRKKAVEVPTLQRFDGSSHDIDNTSPSFTPITLNSSIQLDSSGEDLIPDTNEDRVQRPKMGRKKAKDKKRNGMRIDGSSTLMKEFMVKFEASVQQQLAQSEKEIKSKEEMHRKEQELKERHLNQKDELLRQQAQRIRHKQWLEEKEILMKDLRDMEPHQVEMFRKMQHDIWEKWQRDGTLP